MSAAKDKLLIVGAKGMLGSDLLRILGKDYNITPCDIEEMDITDPIQIEKVLNAIQPSILVNAAAYARVDDCETKQKIAYQVNAEAVGNLAQNCAKRNIYMIHYSTDYVFDGSKGSSYSEGDVTNPQSIYGKSKRRGEEEIIGSCSQYLIIRTAWLYGKNGPNFVDKMIELASTARQNPEKKMRVVDDQIGSPTYTVDLAEATRHLLVKRAKGIVHVTNKGVCSWYDFAVEILKISGMSDVPIKRIKTSEFPRPAKRPAYSVLSMEKLENVFNYKMRSWQEAVAAYLNLKNSKEEHND